jgi:RNA polymerase sigma-70 factor (ECF subfamily)
MTPEEQALANEDRRRVRQVLHALPDRQRQIVELRLADLSGQEIADAMGISLSAMKSAQFRAFQTLRTLLADDVDPTQRSTTR